ncbi:hypothetical protein DPMN_183261 [Dreissena polymorpha]|uniref:Uncharacterized protein n=1 Tax=Dreissena polymorpha TaxID=45954 RepID=A0A9D4DGV2_DREPO|nr:hypothetical protein DPMN_183261 [Dreissena polymorpha]
MIGQTNVTSRVFTSKTNVLTKFHENWAKNVTSRELTCFHYIYIDQNAPPTDGHVSSPIWTIFELFPKYESNQCFDKEKNVLTKFYEDRTKYVTSRVFTCIRYKHIQNTAPPPCRHVFSPIWTIFEIVRDINKTNVLTKFHDDWANILTSKVFTSGHVFQLSNSIDKKNLLTKLHEDRTRNVASIVFTNKCGRTTDGRTTDKDRSQKLT